MSDSNKSLINSRTYVIKTTPLHCTKANKAKQFLKPIIYKHKIILCGPVTWSSTMWGSLKKHSALIWCDNTWLCHKKDWSPDLVSHCHEGKTSNSNFVPVYCQPCSLLCNMNTKLIDKKNPSLYFNWNYSVSCMMSNYSPCSPSHQEDPKRTPHMERCPGPRGQWPWNFLKIGIKC